MRITQVSLSFTETCNLGDYSNTKPSIELTALLDAGDDVHIVINELVTTAKAVIHEKIDEELERVDRSVKYFDGPTFDVIYSSYTDLVAIVPARSVTDLPGNYYYAVKGGIRYEAAKRRAKFQVSQMKKHTRSFDCADGDLTELFAYATEQEQINIAEREEKKRQQEEERARQRAEWEAQQRPTEEEEDDDEEDEEFYDDDEEDSE